MASDFDTRSRSHSVSSTESNVPLPSLEALAPARPPTTTSTSETLLTIPHLKRELRLKVDAGPGCGGIAWPAGEVRFLHSHHLALSLLIHAKKVLSKYVAYRHHRQPENLRDRTVIELGSGTGLVGIVVAMLEPSADVWVTDQQ